MQYTGNATNVKDCSDGLTSLMHSRWYPGLDFDCMKRQQHASPKQPTLPSLWLHTDAQL